MKKNKSASILLLIITCISFNYHNVIAQKDITPYDVVTGKIYPEILRHIQWRSNTDTISYVKNQSIIEWYNNTESTICNVQDLQKYNESIKNIPNHIWTDSTTILFDFRNTLFTFSTNTKNSKTLVTLPKNAKSIALNKNMTITYSVDSTLCLFYNDSIITMQNPFDYYHYDESIYRNEFGYSDGVSWSPSGKKLLFILKNDTIIPDYTFISYDSILPVTTKYKYAFAGGPYEQIKIGVYDLESSNTRFLTLKNTEGYYTNASFNRAENKIYFQYLNRAQDSMACEEYDLENGEYIRTLFSETNKKYVEPLYQVFFYNNDKNFFYISRKNGYKHIYDYSFETGTLTQITHGKFEIDKIIDVTPTGEVLFSGNSEKDNMCQFIYLLKKDKSYNIITKDKGCHYSLSKLHNNKFIEYYTATNLPLEYSVYDIYNKERQSVFIAKNPLIVYNQPEVKFGTIKSADNQYALNYRLILPPEFDKTIQYPVIINVYGGPHLQNVRNSWYSGHDYILMCLAAQGYIIFSLDNRGSANRGMDFESSTFRNLGYNESQDQNKGIEFLKSLSYVDTSRIGMYGWSFGGYMTLTMITDFPKDIKVGVAGSPVVDWNYYEVMYGERYMDTPQENQEGYTSTSIYNKIKNLDGKLLILIGGEDYTTVPAQSMRLLELANSRGISIDFHIYPSQEHGMRGYHRYNVLLKTLEYFQDNL